MAKEIEHKFLVDGCFLSNVIDATRITQGYLNMDPERTVRIRIKGKDEAFITVKGKSSIDGLERDEWEYPIPVPDAEAMLRLPGVQLLNKIRYNVEAPAFSPAGCIWEVDVFMGMNQGLVIAELEVETREVPIWYPDWVGEEVTGDKRYYNSQLVHNPYTKW